MKSAIFFDIDKPTLQPSTFIPSRSPLETRTHEGSICHRTDHRALSGDCHAIGIYLLYTYLYACAIIIHTAIAASILCTI